MIGKRRKYSRKDQVAAGFGKYLAGLLRQGHGKIDSERVLAQRLETSRVTLRKVISESIESGVISRREDDSLTLAIPRDNLLGCGRILFITVGRKGGFAYPAMERLYTHLEKAVTAAYGKIHCFFVNNSMPAARLAAEIAAADVILLGIIVCREPELLSSVISGAGADKIFIRVSGEGGLIPPGRSNFVLPDNYQIGKMAAKLLVNSGCRRPLTFWKRRIGRDFADRAQGFSDMLFQLKCGGVSSVFWLDSLRYAAEGVKLIRWGVQNNYDGFFVMSDEDIGVFAGELYDRRLMQWKMPLVTVDGSQDSLRFDPPICAIGHATSFCTEEIMNALKEIASGRFRQVKKLVMPDFHNASSLLLPDRSR